ncbi:TPR repeat-containing protein [Gottschalkia acidurici 9a]|uniref:TPR repeat-containing protein n=1 Tax=Gottschalkia acidurici (strain ATCC 7906 / DSM 604 / BCRC 14475 / CIP 104303 / KCTC 5404 / NCIMB 10678 / 9a) TaxID=1128398 RepID=K0AYT5_GOTA9|nr:tetratricopeptide repeat protein [Gottschalkia acidurici]AFS77947.1 TPR repeat-containing protein [Gottschalkia acidurici 9a]
MSRLDNYFKKKTKNISFIEIQPDSYIEVSGHKVEKEIPLPIVVDELIDEIQRGDGLDEIKFASFIKGIIYTIGVDPEFKYFEAYKKILYSYDKKIEEYILYISLKSINEGSLESGLIGLRALYFLNEDNLYGKYNYALALEERAKESLNLKDTELANAFLNGSTTILEEILNADSSFHLAYYKLGYHYKNRSEFKKCQLTWEKFLRIGKEEELLQEVRENLDSIKDDVIYEEGYSSILNGDPQSGLDKLLPLEPKYENWWNLYFMIGLGFRQLNLFEEAKGYFEKVLEIEEDQVDAINELGLCLVYLGETISGIQKFTKAIELRPNDYEIMCNRGMSYLQMNDIENAQRDILKAYNINPNDEITIACKNELEKSIM